MTDDEFYALFAVDPADLVAAGLAPVFPSALDPHPAGLVAAGLALALPPIAGGSIIEDFWDWVTDLFGDLGDLGAAIAEAIGNLWDTIWGKLGGALRFVWDWLWDAFDWLAGVLSSMLTQIWSWLWAWPSGLATFIWDRVGTVWGWINSAREWTFSHVTYWARWVKDRVDESARWVRDRVWDAAGWVGDTVVANAVWVRDRVGEFATWIIGSVNTIVNNTRTIITDWLEFLWDEGIQPIIGVTKNIGDAIDFIWDEGIMPIMGAAATIGETLSNLLETIGDKIRDALDWVLNNAFGAMVDTINRKLAIPGKLLRGQYANLFDLMDDVTDPAPALIAGIAGPIILALIIALIVSAVMAVLMQPLTEPHVQDMRATVGAQLLGRADLQEVRWRELDIDVDDQLARYGFDGASKLAIAELDKRIPGSGDLVRFAVREAFDEAKAQALGFVTPPPGEFILWMKRQGFSEEWALRYWWAHWALPSVTQGFEMFHRLRDQFTETELRGLLTAQDVPELWQDRFIQIAYRPFTRVDVRRMFKLGILDETGVDDAYRDLGFDEQKAQAMTEFTKLFGSAEEEGELKEFRDMAQGVFREGYRRHVIERELALDYLVEAGYSEDVADYLLTIDDVRMGIRPDLDADVDVRNLSTSVILRAYREKEWSPERAQTELEALGYLPGSAELLLSLDDLAEERELTGLRISVVKERYLTSDIDLGQASTELDVVGIKSERRDLLLERWTLDKAQKPRRLSVGQLRTAFRADLLTDVQLLDRIGALGHTQEDARLLVDSIDVEPTRRARRLSVSQLQRAFQAGEITDTQLLEGIIGLEYSQADAQILVNLTDPDPGRQLRRLSVAQLTKSFRAGLLTEAQLLDEFLALGYDQRDAEFLVVLAEAAE